MSSLALKVILFALIERVLCDFQPRILDDIERTELSSNATQRKIGSERVIFDDEKISNADASSFGNGQFALRGQKQDRDSYDDRHSLYKGYDRGRHNLGQSEAVDQGKNSLEERGSGYYKKGHHRTGFSNNYHRDESGNNSSFYEDSDDERGHRSSENSGRYYGQKSRDSFRDGLRDALFAGRDTTRRGIYDNDEKYFDRRGYFDRQDDSRYNDDRRNYLSDGSGSYYGREGGQIYYRREQSRPFSYRDQDYIPRNYYQERLYPAPYSRDDRYFSDRGSYHGRDIFYPDKMYYQSNFRNDYYNDGYNDKYARNFMQGDVHRRY
ncbi:hypothetical protein KM043_005816 [Ampulex compressa]|nr:hypothetical protein KM043_005816 [Ampulex compressa]